MNPALQKLLALSLAGLLLAGFVLLVPVPFFETVFAKKQEIKTLEETLGRYHAILDRADTLKSGQGLEDDQLDEYFLEETSPSLGAAGIQRVFSDLGQQTGVVGGSFRPLPENRTNEVRRTGFRVNFQAGSYSFLQFLEKLETARPLLFLENITIKSPRNQNPGADPVLNVQMDVYGLLGENNDS